MINKWENQKMMTLKSILKTRTNLTHMMIHKMKVSSRGCRLISLLVKMICFSQLMKTQSVLLSFLSEKENLLYSTKVQSCLKSAFIITTFLTNHKEGITQIISAIFPINLKLNFSKLSMKSLWMLYHLRISKSPIKWSNYKTNRLNSSEKYLKSLLLDSINKNTLIT